jgi:hypothetical protein
MNADKLSSLIAEENERLESSVADGARQIIREILKGQKIIQDTNARIAELRDELKKLSVDSIDAKAVLGE